MYGWISNSIKINEINIIHQKIIYIRYKSTCPPCEQSIVGIREYIFFGTVPEVRETRDKPILTGERDQNMKTIKLVLTGPCLGMRENKLFGDIYLVGLSSNGAILDWVWGFSSFERRLKIKN